MIKETDDIQSELPEVIITKQPDANVNDHDVPSRNPSRERSSRSVSISRLKVNDPMRKELMFVREKSPFEIGENRNVQVASSKAIIDKALIMDVSGGITKVDEYVSLFFSSGCVIDEAVCKDITEEHEVEIIVFDDISTSTIDQPANIDESETDNLFNEVSGQTFQSKEKNDETVIEENQPTNLKSPDDANQIELPIQGTPNNTIENVTKDQDQECAIEEKIIENIEQRLNMTETTGKTKNENDQNLNDTTETRKNEYDQDLKTNDETEESSEEEEESSSDESFEELVDPSLWKAYDSNDEDDSAWFYKKTEDRTPELTEKEKDDEFRKDRLARRIPIFLTNLTDRSVASGSEVKLQCSIEGFGVTVKWMKDDNVFERSSKLRTTAVDGLYTLLIKHVDKSDEGIYTILAKNRGGEVTSSARIQVYDDIKEKIELPTIIKIRGNYLKNIDLNNNDTMDLVHFIKRLFSFQKWGTIQRKTKPFEKVSTT